MTFNVTVRAYTYPSSCNPFLLCVPLRTLIHGDKKGGFTVFWADDGLDTGPILLQRECEVEPNDTVNTIYKRFLFPEGVKGTVREGTGQCIVGEVLSL